MSSRRVHRQSFLRLPFNIDNYLDFTRWQLVKEQYPVPIQSPGNQHKEDDILSVHL